MYQKWPRVLWTVICLSSNVTREVTPPPKIHSHHKSFSEANRMLSMALVCFSHCTLGILYVFGPLSGGGGGSSTIAPAELYVGFFQVSLPMSQF